MGIPLVSGPRNRRGYSLVEVAVVTGILALVMALMLPMLGQARNAARRQMCASNMREVAKAVLYYEGLQGRLPVAGLVGNEENGHSFHDPGYDQNSGAQLSWVVLVLPFLEESRLYDDFNLEISVGSQEKNPQSRSVPILLCPSDNAGDRVHISRRFGGKEFGLGNYGAYISPVHGEHEQHWPGALGGFEPGSMDGQRLRKISDGVVHTLMLGEIRSRPTDERDPRGVWAVPWIGSATLSADVHPVVDDNGDIRDTPFIPDTNIIQAVAQTPNRQTGIHDQIRPCPLLVTAKLDRMPCSRYFGYGTGFTSAAPRSLHNGGVNTAYVDGRIEFVVDEIDPLVFGRRVSTNDAGVEHLFSHEGKRP